MAQKMGRETAANLERHGLKEVSASRGESAYVIDAGEKYIAFVQEGLGTKNLVADELSDQTGRTYYETLAEDTIAMIINDLITVGALQQSVLAYWAVGSSAWFDNLKRAQDLIAGWAAACQKAGVVWGGGETPTLPGVIHEDTIDLAGSAYGVIHPKSRLVLGDRLAAGDKIVVFASSGIHANGLTLARELASRLPEGYMSKLASGQSYGEALLTPTVIYAKLINDLQAAGVDIHYMANITGHGWRKLMRATKSFTYRITSLPPVPEVLQFICEKGPVSDEEAYANFNMGAGFAVFVPNESVATVVETASKHNIKAYKIGTVEEGEKQVIIEPKNITYKAESLQVKS